MRIERTDNGLWTKWRIGRGTLHVDLSWYEGNWHFAVTWIGD